MQEIQTTQEVQLTSPAFEAGGAIPSKYTGDGADVSPPLAWGRLPQNTAALALIVDDPDAPAGPFTHWTWWDVPPGTRGLPEGANVPDLGGTQGENSLAGARYSGPCPPPGARHRYFFRLYALDEPLALPEGADRHALHSAMDGHVLGQATLVGTYLRG